MIPQPPAPSTGRILIEAAHHRVVRLFAPRLVGSGPVITLDGHRVHGRWGTNSFDVPPGTHHVRVELGHPATGVAQTWLVVGPGQSTRVYYQAPAVAMTPGRVGPVPQPTPGIRFLVLVLLLVSVCLAALVIGVLVRIA